MSDAVEATPSRWQAIGLGGLAGALICFALPPWGWWPLGIIGIAVWGWLSSHYSTKGRAAVGAWVALVWFLPSTVWMAWLTAPGWVVGVACWYPALGALTGALSPPGRRGPIGLAATVVFAEWIRWHAPFGGVPISMLAMTQGSGAGDTWGSPLLVLARLGGPMLISFAVALVGASLVAATERRRRAAVALLGLVVAAVLIASIAPSGRNQGDPIDVAIVQGGGPQGTIDDGSQYGIVFQRHVDATETIDRPVSLIVWPENVVNVYEFAHSAERSTLIDLANRHRAPIVVGIVEDTNDAAPPGSEETEFFNAVVVIEPGSSPDSPLERYDKVRRVPFGEYVPLRSLIEPLAPDTLPGQDAVPGVDPAIVDSSVGRLGVMISWEVFFGRRGRAAANGTSRTTGGVVDDGRAAILLNPTNGSSYHLTIVQSQQIATSRMRALETGRWLLQAAPTGFSAAIDPDGSVHQRSGVSEESVILTTVSKRRGRTIELVTGDLIPLLGAALAALIAWRPFRRATAVSSPSDGFSDIANTPVE